MRRVIWFVSTFPMGHVLGCLAFCLAAAAASAAEPYRLNVSDSIRVRVVQWQPAESELAEWGAVGGEYVVGPDGGISFPFVGEAQSAGKTTAELAAALSDGLRQSLGLMAAPNVAIEIVKFGPVYVTGDVQSSGEYAYAPGLNVIKAIALAGGERRSVDVNARIDRDLIGTKGTLDVLRSEYQRLLARRARIDAELGAAGEVPMPAELADAEGGAALVAVEQAVLDANDRQVKSSLDAIASQKVLLNRELETLAQKRTNAEQQLALAQEQLDNVKSLADQGLAISSRVSQLQASVADFSGRLLDIDTAVLTAKQGLGSADRESAEIGGKRISDLTLERQQVDGDIAELQLKIGTQEGLMHEAVQFGARVADEGNREPIYAYDIIRGGEEIAAERTTELQPGDVITVTLSY